MSNIVNIKIDFIDLSQSQKKTESIEIPQTQTKKKNSRCKSLWQQIEMLQNIIFVHEKKTPKSQ